MKYLLVLAALALGLSNANAQNPVITQPYPVNTDNASSTIANTNTFQSVWIQDTNTTGRTACTIQNNSTSNKMYVFFGPIANATISNSVTLSPGDRCYCHTGEVILKDQVSITGTSGDIYYAARQ